MKIARSELASSGCFGRKIIDAMYSANTPGRTSAPTATAMRVVRRSKPYDRLMPATTPPILRLSMSRAIGTSSHDARGDGGGGGIGGSQRVSPEPALSPVALSPSF